MGNPQSYAEWEKARQKLNEKQREALTHYDQARVVWLLEALVNGVKDTGGWREHVQLIKAWNAGLDWFVNYTDGHDLNDTWQEYVDWLIASGYEKLPRPDGCEDDGPTFEKGM